MASQSEPRGELPAASSPTSGSQMAPPPSPAPGPAPRWVVLRRVPRVCRTYLDLPKGADFSLALAAPPCLTQVTVPPRIAPDSVTAERFPYVLAADPSGVLLINSTDGRATGPLAVDKPAGASKLVTWSDYATTFFVCDALTAAVVRLPDRNEPVIHPANVGLIVAPGATDHHKYMVVELVPLAAGHRATLLCFSSETVEWVKRSPSYPLLARPWFSAGAFSYEGKLWWVDLSRGLLAYDAFANSPDLCFVPLPKGKELPIVPGRGDLHKYRCVNLSSGKLRFVAMTGRVVPPTVGVWTLVDPEAGEWKLEHEHEVSFQEIWDDESYKATGLPDKGRPVLALVHPENPDVVYFFLEGHLCGVNLRSKKVEGCAACEPVTQPTRDEESSRFVLSWELPPSLITSPGVSSKPGLVKKDNDTNVAEDPASQASLPAPDVAEASVPQASLPTPDMAKASASQASLPSPDVNN